MGSKIKDWSDREANDEVECEWKDDGAALWEGPGIRRRRIGKDWSEKMM